MFRRLHRPLAAGAVLQALLVGIVAAGFSSCASVSVKNVIALAPPPQQVPRTIYVAPFEFVEGAILVDREGRRLAEFEGTLRRQMSADLVQRLPEYVAPAEHLPDSLKPPSAGSHWLLKGKFTRLNQGSRFLRGSLGLGAGGTKMDVSATVYDLSSGTPQPFLLIETTGGSNASPGAIMGVFAWPLIAAGAPGLIEGVSGDCRRTAREITGALAEFLREKGVRVAGKTPRVKHKGGLAYPWWSSGPPRDPNQP